MQNSYIKGESELTNLNAENSVSDKAGATENVWTKHSKIWVETICPEDWRKNPQASSFTSSL